VTFTYQVTNLGNVPLSNVFVTDDNGTPGNTADDLVLRTFTGDTNGNGLLDLARSSSSRRRGSPRPVSTPTSRRRPAPLRVAARPSPPRRRPDNHFGASPTPTPTPFTFDRRGLHAQPTDLVVSFGRRPRHDTGAGRQQLHDHPGGPRQDSRHGG
jgi:hypothetical protein